MRLKIKPEELLPQLSRCARVASAEGGKKGAALRPIYEYVYLAAAAGVVTLRVQDPAVFFEARILCPTGIESGGEVLVSCEKLLRLVRNRVEGHPVELSVKEGFLHVSQSGAHAKLPLLRNETIDAFSAEVVPALELEADPKWISSIVRAGNALEDVAGQESKYKGVLLDVHNGELWICGFSSSLLFAHRFDVQTHVAARQVLSMSALPLLGALGVGPSTRLLCDTKNARLVLAGPDYLLVARTVEDGYPKAYAPYLGLHRMSAGSFPVTQINEAGEVVEERDRFFLKFDRQGLLYALGTAACLLSKDEYLVEMSIASQMPDGKFLVELSGQNRLTSAISNEKVLAESNLTHQVAIGLHHGRVREALKAMTSEFVRIFVRGPADPVVLIEDGDTTFAAMSIPLRLG